MNKIFCISFTLFISVIVLFHSCIKSSEMREKYLEREANMEFQKDSLVKIIDVLLNTNNIISPKIKDCLVRNTSTGKEINLFNVLEESPTILIRLINTGCSSCNQEQIKLLKNLINRDNLIILINTTNMRLLRLFLKENNITSTIYWLKETDTLFQEDDSQKILVSYVNTDGTILRAYHINLEMFFLVESLVDYSLRSAKNEKTVKNKINT